MDRLLAKHDYFKHTTRVILTESEKLETLRVVERAAAHFGRLGTTSRIEFSTNGNGRTVMRSVTDRLEYLGRWITLMKGSTQPRHLYRRRRRFDLEMEARKIAIESGTEYTEVRDLFIRLMHKYISEEP